MPTQHDTGTWHAHATVHTFDAEARAAALSFHQHRTLNPFERRRLAHRELTGPELLAWHAQATAPEGVEVIEADGNLLTRLGLARIGNRLIGTASNQAIDATHCRIGVGDSNTAAATTDTDLGAAAGSGHRQFKLVDSVVQGTGANSGVTTIVATFGTGVANFAWAEWGIDGGTADSTTVTADTNTTPGLVNHKITSLLTKTAAVVAVFTVTITIS